MEFDAATEEIVYCKAACGNNVHKGCFEKWATAKKSAGVGVTCPFCRTKWEVDREMVGAIDKAAGKITREGYTNVASQLGISGLRGMSFLRSTVQAMRCRVRKAVALGADIYQSQTPAPITNSGCEERGITVDYWTKIRSMPTTDMGSHGRSESSGGAVKIGHDRFKLHHKRNTSHALHKISNTKGSLGSILAVERMYESTCPRISR